MKGKSFGFSDAATINLDFADTLNGAKRISWILENEGGFRAGDITYLN